MNKQRRNRLSAITDKLTEQKEAIDEVRAEEADAFDNLPESFQDGEQGAAIQSAIDFMDEALGAIDEALSPIEEAIA